MGFITNDIDGARFHDGGTLLTLHEDGTYDLVGSLGDMLKSESGVARALASLIQDERSKAVEALTRASAGRALQRAANDAASLDVMKGAARLVLEHAERLQEWRQRLINSVVEP
jgi:hypothetical protein